MLLLVKSVAAPADSTIYRHKKRCAREPLLPAWRFLHKEVRKRVIDL